MLTKSVLFLLCKRSIVILQPQFVVYLSLIEAYQSSFHLRSFYTSFASSLSEQLHCYVVYCLRLKSQMIRQEIISRTDVPRDKQ